MCPLAQWFHNLDKIIHYVNYHASKGGPVVAFYSTPSHYTDAKFEATIAVRVSTRPISPSVAIVAMFVQCPAC